MTLWPFLFPTGHTAGKAGEGGHWVEFWVNHHSAHEVLLGSPALSFPSLCLMSLMFFHHSHFTVSKNSSSWVSQGSDSCLSLHSLAGRKKVAGGTFSAEKFPSKSQCLIPDLRGTLPQIISVPSAYWQAPLFYTGISKKQCLTCFARSKWHPWLRNFFCIV